MCRPPSAHAPTGTEVEGDDLELLRKTHWAIDKVSTDLRRFAFNTAIAAVMELLNECSRLRDAAAGTTLRFALATAASLLFPFAPHLGAEVYERLDGGQRVWEQPWPQADPRCWSAKSTSWSARSTASCATACRRATDAGAEQLKELVARRPNVQAHLDGKEVVKEIVVPGKLVNLVVR